MPSPITDEERAQLMDLTVQLNALREILMFAVEDSQAIADLSSISAADLKPTGNLSALAGRIAGRVPISDAELKVLIEEAEHDIKSNSRFNGLVSNATTLLKVVRTTVLPLLI